MMFRSMRLTPLLIIWTFSIAGLMIATDAGAVPAKPFWEEGKKESNIQTIKGLPNIADLAENLKKKIVNIQVSKKVQGPQGQFRFRGPSGERPPFHEFFEKFFGDQLPKEFEQKSMGSGVIITKDGYVLTNNHVVQEADEILVKLSENEQYEGKVVGRDPTTDIALVKIEATHDLPSAILGDSDQLRVGEWVIAIGNPFGLEHTVTTGIVSAKGRVIGSGPYDDFIQTDASINPGNSGGPLLNLKGEVVGINTAIIASGHGIGFAIPINMAKKILPQLREKGQVTRGWLGVQIQSWESGLARKFGLEEERGALVGRVMEGEPAAKAGIRNGDVILQIGDHPIEDSRDLLNTVAGLQPGQEIEVVVFRDGKEVSLQVTLGERPSDGLIAERQTPDQEQRLGLTVQEITPALAEQLGLEKADGILISDVKPGSPGAKAGLRRGDIIREMERTPVRNIKDYRRILSEAEGGSLLLWVQRGPASMYAVLNLED